ncbi:hypothetical protein [Candidatus Cyanaurora vandensis]|uniref:hypothetical protein n=1 Tax=Candidatus Cyanaurora vandensis TaxID=2714958 RepID=UPI0025810C62|nr:hypothetical protein [Candidatus Cyanaurora vandensis]
MKFVYLGLALSLTPLAHAVPHKADLEPTVQLAQALETPPDLLDEVTVTADRDQNRPTTGGTRFVTEKMGRSLALQGDF